MSEIDKSGKALVDFWKWAADKGLMNANSAGALRGASLQVLSAIDDWETVDVSTLDIEDVFRRFRNKRSRDFKPASLSTYQTRFNSAVRMFLDYVKDPAKWRPPPIKERKERMVFSQPKQATNSPNAGNATKEERESEDADVVVRQEKRRDRNPDLVEFLFPLRGGVLAMLCLPADLKLAEVARLNVFLKSLAVDQSASDDSPNGSG